MGADNVEAINSISGERCSPHPHNFTDRLIRPGARVDGRGDRAHQARRRHDKIARAFPKAPEIGFESEMAAFGLNFCHGIGLGLHERPIISRVNSFDDPMELQAGMMFAVETYCPATDDTSAARIEEEVIVTPEGAKIITLFPAEELPIEHHTLPVG